MELLNLISDFIKGNVPGFFGFLNRINTTVAGEIANTLHTQPEMLLGLGICLTVAIGMLAYKYVKIFLSLIASVLGFFAGTELYFALQTETMPNWVGYVFGLVLMVVFFWLAYGRASYVWYAMVAILGYCITRFYIADSLVAAIGGAFVLAMLSIAFFRILYLALTSLGCGVLTTSLIWGMGPGCGVFALSSHNAVFWLMSLLLTLLFVAVQLLLTSPRIRKWLG